MAIPPLIEITDTVDFKGIPFPSQIDIRKLIVTGPPGSGKTTVLTAIGGWLEEGYLDISSAHWWKSFILDRKPRELHFGVPFVGYEDAVPVYDVNTLDDPSYLELDLLRIPLPPPDGGVLANNFRKKLHFEFLLPPPELLFERRRERAKRGTHHVDQNLTLDQVREEYHLFMMLAHFFHTSGMNIHIRQDSKGPPMRFDETLEDHSTAKVTQKKELQQLHDTIKLKQRILNRAWSVRGNQELLELFVDILPGALEVERCNIFINDPSEKEAWLLCSTGLDGGQTAVSNMRPFVNEVISNGEYLVKEEIKSSQPASANYTFVLRNTLIVPIKSISGNNQTGAIQILNKLGKKKIFTEEDRLLLEKVALHLQLAFENVFLRHEMMDFSQVLSLKNEREAVKNKIILVIVTLMMTLSVAVNFMTYKDRLFAWLLSG